MATGYDSRRRTHNDCIGRLRPTLSYLKGISKSKLQKHYRYIIERFQSVEALNTTLHDKKLFSQEVYNLVQNQKNEIRKRHCLLKQVLRLPEKDCFRFVQVLNDLECDIDLNKLVLSTEKSIPTDDHISEYLTKLDEIIENNFDRLLSQLEVHKVLDSLFEFSVLTIDDHDQILNNDKRKTQKEILFAILQRKPSWKNAFVRVLKETDQIHILQSENSYPQAAALWNDIPEFGNTVPLTADSDENLDLLFTIVSENATDRILLRNMTDEEAVIQECLNNGILDARPGNSIYIELPLCLRRSDIQIDSTITRKLKQIFQIISRNNEKSTKIQTFNVKIRVKKHSSYWEQTHDKENRFYRPSSECLRCVKQTVLNNINLILDEIESDIITETFSALGNVSDFIRKSCMLSLRPRKERAKHFVMYVMQHADALTTFMKVFSEKSSVDLIQKKCEACRDNGETVITTSKSDGEDILKNKIFKVTIDKSNIAVKVIEDESRHDISFQSMISDYANGKDSCREKKSHPNEKQQRAERSRTKKQKRSRSLSEEISFGVDKHSSNGVIYQREKECTSTVKAKRKQKENEPDNTTGKKLHQLSGPTTRSTTRKRKSKE